MSGKNVVVMVTPGDDRVWFEGTSLVDYLRRVQDSAHVQANDADDRQQALCALAVGDALRQLGDGLTLTLLEAVETLRDRRS